MRPSKFALVLSILPALAVGCGEARRALKTSYLAEDGAATLRVGPIRVVFESIEISSVSGVGGDTELTVSGPGSGLWSLGLSESKLSATYCENTSTFKLDRIPAFELRIVDGGRRAEIDGLSFDLEGRNRTIVVHADGTTTVS